MTPKHLAAIAALVLGGAAPALADDDCRLERVTSIPMSIDREGGVYVPMTIGGKPVNLLIDTGGIDSMLTQSTVDDLDLHTELMDSSTYFVLFGGARIDSYANGHDIVLGTLKARNMQFLIMPDGHMAPELQGTLGPDVLRAYDDDFDFANAAFNLFSPDHCAGRVVYWTKDPAAEIPFTYYNMTHISFPVLLDGKPIQAELDTGASRSVFSREEAARLFGPALPLKNPFKTMTFGGVTVSNPDIVLVADKASRLPGAYRLILGMGILRQLHLYIAHGEKKLYVTPAAAH